jgi:hypothetical protein
MEVTGADTGAGGLTPPGPAGVVTASPKENTRPSEAATQ